MGKRLITQKRGRGTPTYKAPSHRYKGKISHRKYDEQEKNGTVKGQIIDLIHCPGHGAPIAVVKYEDKELTLIAIFLMRALSCTLWCCRGCSCMDTKI